MSIHLLQLQHPALGWVILVLPSAIHVVQIIHLLRLQPDIVTAQIQKELANKRIRQIPTLPSNYFCSPLGLIPKSIDNCRTGWRIIFDLSSPENSSVNDGILKEYGTIVYETLNDAIRLIVQAGRGAVMMKRDLKSAFRHIPISPCDYWLLIFEWDGKFYIDMFLPFGLRTAPRIFNYFAEALHWVLETLNEWNLTHYLDDFLIIFPPNIDITSYSQQFDEILAKFGFSKAEEKDADGCVIVYLGFEFDSNKMELRLPVNKKVRAVRAVQSLLSSTSVTFSELQRTLGFLSHCCQVVPLGRPFLRSLFALLHQNDRRHRFRRIRLSHTAKRDLHWWQCFLNCWSSVSLIQISRQNHDIATDASGIKGIGGIYKRVVFSCRFPARHRSKHINWKEMSAILHAFLLWHSAFSGGTVRLACDNDAVVDAINKHSIKGPAIRPLQDILLIAAVFDINLFAFWVPTEENIVADAASRHDYRKLANMGLQVSVQPPAKDLRRKLTSLFTNRSPIRPDVTMNASESTMSHSVPPTSTMHSQPHSPHSLTGLHSSCRKPSLLQRSHTSRHSVPVMSETASQSPPSMTPASIFSSAGQNDITALASNESGSPLPLRSSFELSMASGATRRVSTSKRRSVWHLPPSYDLENLHGILPGPTNTISTSSLVNMSSSTLTIP